MRRVAPVIVVALLLIAIGLVRRGGQRLPYTTASAEAFDLYQEGNQQLWSFQWGLAEQSLRRALEIDPDFAMAHAALAELYRARSRFLHADSPDFAPELAVADSLARHLPDPLEQRLVLLRLSNLNRLGTVYQDSLLALVDQQAPHHLLVLVTKALRAERVGDIDTVWSTWQEILKINPNFAHAYNNLGYIAAGRGDYAEAIRLLQKYVFLAPDLANPHDSLGEILIFVGRYEEAEHQFRRALALQPDFFVSLVNLARVYIEQGKLQQGLDLLARTRWQIEEPQIRRWFDGVVVRLFLANWLPDQLRQAATRYVTSYPEDRLSDFFRIFLLTFAHRLDAASALADSVLAAYRQGPSYQANPVVRRRVESGAHRLAALFASYRHRLDLAATEWQQALDLALPAPPHELYALRVPYGRTLADLGRYTEALQQAQAVLATNPRNLGALLLQTEALLAVGSEPEARQAYGSLQRALAEADPSLPAVARADSLGRILGPG